MIAKNLHEFLHIHRNRNEDVTLLEATISVTFSVDTLEDLLAGCKLCVCHELLIVNPFFVIISC